MLRFRSGFFLVAPLLVLLVTVCVLPFLIAAYVSVTDLNLALSGRSGAFVGMENYRQLLLDHELHRSLRTTFTFAFTSVIGELVLGVLLGIYLYKKRTQQSMLIPLVALPLLLAPVVTGLIWRLLYQGEFGLVSYLLQLMGLFEEASITSNPSTALFAVVLVDVWQWTPFVALMVFVQRTLLPKSPFEAAALDGASPVVAVRTITIPLLVPLIAMLGLLRFIDAFREFDKVFVLTSGGPGSATELISIYAWRIIFRNWDFGYGAALSVALYLVIFSLSWLVFRSRAWRQSETK
uniref:Carbohydrate ABC transporter membrane protein 1, CUT1 family n=1 Tax=Candidatus Kentrum sp. DK TaxID=2126562 RepID=A0A450SN47_9GAMM|nr:MAG: carbohydrate ABC transporter membrane protein 1, CUT1 family [Candidatus Kentron sp. DK]